MRIALATVGTTGDVRPFRILGHHLAQRGHDVLAISWPMHANALAAPGVNVETAGPLHDAATLDAVAEAAAGRDPLEQVRLLRDFHLADGTRHYRALFELLGGHDLVIIHGIHAIAHAVVLDRGLRWASLAFDPTLLATPSLPPPGMPNLGPFNRVLWRVLDQLLGTTGVPLDHILAAVGSHQRRLPLFRARSSLCHLVACSPAIARVPERLPGGATFTGAILDPAPPDPLPPAIERFLSDGPPPIVISFGSMRGIPVDAILESGRMLVEAGHRVIVQATEGARTSARDIIGIEAVDHRALFPRVSAVVHHAGAGTTHAVAAAGIPSVTVPHIGDQVYWADRLHRLGCSPTPMRLKDVSPQRLAVEAAGVVDAPAMSAAAAQLRDRMAADDGLGTIVHRLEAMARKV